jgi:hypothetical protein
LLKKQKENNKEIKYVHKYVNFFPAQVLFSWFPRFLTTSYFPRRHSILIAIARAITDRPERAQRCLKKVVSACSNVVDGRFTLRIP